MRVVVVGAGAVGTLLGHVLAAAGSDVLLLRRSGPADHQKARRWSRLEPDGREVEASLRLGRVAAIGDLPPPDVLVLAVKQFDLDAALASVAAWPSTPTVTVQNGVGAEERAAIARPGAAIVAASLTASCAVPAPGRVVRLTPGGIGLAPFAATPDRLPRDLSESFVCGGLRSRLYRDARAMKWSKLVGNLVGNALGAITDLEPDRLYADEGLFALERAQLREALAVMDGLGLRPVALPGAPIPWLARAVRLPSPAARAVLARAVSGARGGKVPSLLEHARSGIAGPTEVRWLNGAVAWAATAAGVQAPVNAALASLVDEVVADARLRARLRHRPAEAHAAVLAARSAPAAGTRPER